MLAGLQDNTTTTNTTTTTTNNNNTDCTRPRRTRITRSRNKTYPSTSVLNVTRLGL